MVSITPSKAYGKQFWLILALSPATRAGTAEEKQPPGALTANKLAVKQSKSGELQGGAEMHLIGNKQGLRGPGSTSSSWADPAEGMCDKLVFTSKLLEAILIFCLTFLALGSSFSIAYGINCAYVVSN